VTAIQIIAGPVGPSLPVSIRNARLRANEHEGKADPTWGTKFTTKFSKKPPENAEPVVPMGAAKVVHDFLDRVAEIDYLISTQHRELATTRQEMSANGIRSFSIQSLATEEGAVFDVSESELDRVEAALDPVYMTRLGRRIDWEKFIYACGPVHRARFERTKDNTLGIAYDGPSKDADFILALKRALKYGWIERFGALPTVQDVEQGRVFANWYKQVVRAYMTDAQMLEDKASRMFGTEEPDEYRVAFHAENPRTARLVWDEESESMITDDLPGGIDDVGYAGPAGMLGIDEDALASND